MSRSWLTQPAGDPSKTVRRLVVSGGGSSLIRGFRGFGPEYQASNRRPPGLLEIRQILRAGRILYLWLGLASLLGIRGKTVCGRGDSHARLQVGSPADAASAKQPTIWSITRPRRAPAETSSVGAEPAPLLGAAIHYLPSSCRGLAGSIARLCGLCSLLFRLLFFARQQLEKKLRPPYLFHHIPRQNLSQTPHRKRHNIENEHPAVWNSFGIVMFGTLRWCGRRKGCRKEGCRMQKGWSEVDGGRMTDEGEEKAEGRSMSKRGAAGDCRKNYAEFCCGMLQHPRLDEGCRGGHWFR